MQPEAIHKRSRRPIAKAVDRLPAAWSRPLAWLALVWASALLLTMQQWLDMARQWFTISTYQHILFVPPIIAWLVWNRRDVLAGIAPRAWLPGLAMVAAALFVWLVGTLTSLDLIAQAGAVMVLQMAVLAVLGPRAAAALAFPIGFAVFLVPFGEEIVTPLQMLTAEMVIALTHLSGIPAQIDGIFIDTPAGLFEVAEACAGVQFVVAMLTLGVLAAKVGMTRWPHRIAMLTLCLVVPILANGVRAWAIIAIAQHVGAERAGGIDHIVYGWVFFALVVALVMALAWRWFDRDPEAEGRSAARWASHPLVAAIDRFHLRASTIAPLLVALIALAGLWSGLARSANAEAVVPNAPEVPGWSLVETPMRTDWQPTGAAASERLHVIYRDRQGRSVDLYLAAYRGDADPTASAEGAVPQDTPWRRVRGLPATPDMMGEELVWNATRHRMAWTGYVAGGVSSANTLALRLSGLGERLALRAQPRWLVIISTSDGASREEAKGLLH